MAEALTVLCISHVFAAGLIYCTGRHGGLTICCSSGRKFTLRRSGWMARLRFQADVTRFTSACNIELYNSAVPENCVTFPYSQM